MSATPTTTAIRTFNQYIGQLADKTITPKQVSVDVQTTQKENAMTRVQFSNTLEDIGRLGVTWQDTNRDTVINRSEVTLTNPKMALKATALSPQVWKQLAGVIAAVQTEQPETQKTVSPSDDYSSGGKASPDVLERALNTLAMLNPEKAEKAIAAAKPFYTITKEDNQYRITAKPAEAWGKSSNTTITETTEDEELTSLSTTVVSSAVGNNTSGSSPLLTTLKTQSASSQQIPNWGGCTLHAAANAITQQIQNGTASDTLKAALARHVVYNPSTKAYTFTPADSPEEPIVVTAKEITEKQVGYRKNNAFGIAVELAWNKLHPETKGEGNAADEVLTGLFGLKSETAKPKAQLAVLKQYPGRTGILLVHSRKNDPEQYHALTIAYNDETHKFVVTDSATNSTIKPTTFRGKQQYELTEEQVLKTGGWYGAAYITIPQV
jgi:hypothetical protein